MCNYLFLSLQPNRPMHKNGAAKSMHRKEADRRPPACHPVSVQQLQRGAFLPHCRGTSWRQCHAHARSPAAGVLRGK